MKLSTAVMWIITSLVLVVAFASKGGFFKPDNVIGIDTLVIVDTVEIPLDTIFINVVDVQCNMLSVEDSLVAVSHVRVYNSNNFYSMIDKPKWIGMRKKYGAYRECITNRVVQYGEYGVVF